MCLHDCYVNGGGGFRLKLPARRRLITAPIRWARVRPVRRALETKHNRAKRSKIQSRSNMRFDRLRRRVLMLISSRFEVYIYIRNNRFHFFRARGHSNHLKGWISGNESSTLLDRVSWNSRRLSVFFFQNRERAPSVRLSVARTSPILIL